MFKKKKKMKYICDLHIWRDDRYKCPNCADEYKANLGKQAEALDQEMKRLMGTITQNQLPTGSNYTLTIPSGTSLQGLQGQSAGSALKLTNPDPYTITYPIDLTYKIDSHNNSQYYFPDFNPADTSNLKVEFKPEDFKELRIDGDECSVFQAWAAKIANKLIANKISKLPIILLKQDTSFGTALPIYALIKADNIDDATYGAFLVKFPEKK